MEALIALNDIPQHDQNQISQFYERLMSEFFIEAAYRFIDKQLHREEFIRSVYTIISDLTDGKLNLRDDDAFDEEILDKVHFFFNRFEGEDYAMAEGEIRHFIINYKVYEEESDEEGVWIEFPYYDPYWNGPYGWYGGYYWDGVGWYDRPGGRYYGSFHPNYARDHDHGQYRPGGNYGGNYGGNRGGGNRGGDRGRR
jgi:hypothetical protein